MMALADLVRRGQLPAMPGRPRGHLPGLAALTLVGLALPALACGPARLERLAVQAVTAEGEIIGRDGARFRLAGLRWPDGVAPGAALPPILFIGRLAPADRWSRTPVLAFEARGEAVGTWVQGAILAEGRAMAWPEAGLGACWPRLLAAEAPARQAARGLWRAEGATWPASLPAARWASLAGRSVIVEGRLARVGVGRRHAFLRFTEAPRDGFFAMIPRSWVAGRGDSVVDATAWRGQGLRLRGRLDDRDGRRLRIERIEQIERE